RSPRVFFRSPNTASSAGHQFSHNLSPLAAKDHHQRPDEGDFQSIAIGALPTTPHIAVPPPLHHPPETHVRSHRRTPSRGRLLFSSFRNNSNQPKPIDVKVNRLPSGSRLWNPINHVPRTTVVTPSLAQQSDEDLSFAGAGRDVYPLLSIPEQRRSRLTPSPNSLSVERSAAESESGRTSIALPRSRRRSEQLEGLEFAAMPENTEDQENGSGKLRPDDGITHPPRHVQSNSSLRNSTYASYPSGGNPNAGGDGEAEVAEELAWGPAHPCYPHMNPHVPLHSEEFTTTRIIRIRRDWMVKGDLAPTFSNLYPEILDPLVSEQEFRRIIAKVNSELVKAFDPFSLRSWFDSAMGLVTGWVWDDLGFPGIKAHLRRVEDWLDKWNREVGSKENVRIWSLRRTAYMTLDIQIPDPKVGPVNSEAHSAAGTRPNTGPTSRIPAPETHER
ncbi:Golgin subfamily A member 7/ERF4 family-domain-containing protein, partial [Talaromyces proteolyticus]